MKLRCLLLGHSWASWHGDQYTKLAPNAYIKAYSDTCTRCGKENK